jgi:hypothetical protein
LGGALLGEPEREAIAVKVAVAMDLKFKFDLVMIMSFIIELTLEEVYQVSPPNWLRSEALGRRSNLAATRGLRSGEYT